MHGFSSIKKIIVLSLGVALIALLVIACVLFLKKIIPSQTQSIPTESQVAVTLPNEIMKKDTQDLSDQDNLLLIKSVFKELSDFQLNQSNNIKTSQNENTYVMLIKKETSQYILDAVCFSIDRDKNVQQVGQYKHDANGTYFATRESLSPITCQKLPTQIFEGKLNCLPYKPEIYKEERTCFYGLSLADGGKFFIVKDLGQFLPQEEIKEGKTLTIEGYLKPNPTINPFETEGVIDIREIIQNIEQPKT